MSFMRVGRSQQSLGKRSVRPKKTGGPRREWVSTVNDLSVHKLTPEELSHRHEMHKSHNKAAAQWELKEGALRRRLRHPASPAPLDRTSLSIIREVFSDQLLLQDVLSRSDRAMAVVKDLFGDAPRRQTGHPSVTMAPDCDSDATLPVILRPDPPTSLSLLSQSMMDQQALNELEASEEDHSDEDTCPSASFNSNIVHRRNLQKTRVKGQGRGAQRQRVHQGAGERLPVTPCTSGRAPDQAALNATVKVQRLRARRSQSEDQQEEEPSSLVAQVLNLDPPLNQSDRSTVLSGRARKTHVEAEGSGLDGSSLSSLSGNQSSLGLLQAMLGQVEADLDSMGPGGSLRAPGPAQGTQTHSAQGLTGFSVALVSTLGRLAHLLRQREEETQREAEERRRLEEEVKEQWGLIDALTAETLALREESAALQAGLQQRTAELEQRLDTVVLALGELGLLGTHSDHGPQDSGFRPTACESGPHYTERDPGRPQAPVSPAVLLSPPRQRDNWQRSPVVGPVGLHQQLSLPDPRLSYEDIQAFSSAPSLSSLSSLSSLPLLNLPSMSSQAVPSTSSRALPSTSSRALPSTSSQALPSTSSQALLSTSSQALLSTSSQALPSTSSQALPSTSSQALLSTSSQALPSTSSRALPSTSSQALPSTSSQALPSTSSQALPSDPLTSQLSQETMLAQIVQLTRQNDLIRAQLNQAGDLGSGGRGSPNSSTGRRGSSSSSTGRATPQSVSERRMSGSSNSVRGLKQDQSERESRMSGSSSAGRGVKQDQSERESRMSGSSSAGRGVKQDQSERESRMSGSSSAGRGVKQDQSEREGGVAPTRGEQFIQQSAAPDPLRVQSVEQRLLELNRQSTAARSRLLELIEQQRQSVSDRVSPSVSPIPPPGFSPHPAGDGRNPKVSVLLPAQDPSPQAAGGGRRSAGVEASLLSLGGEHGDGQTQEDKLTGEGWFALSTHVR